MSNNTEVPLLSRIEQNLEAQKQKQQEKLEDEQTDTRWKWAIIISMILALAVIIIMALLPGKKDPMAPNMHYAKTSHHLLGYT